MELGLANMIDQLLQEVDGLVIRQAMLVRRHHSVEELLDDLPTVWPWTYDRFRAEMRAPRLADYEIR